jgi:hypothetical protein
MNKYFNYGDIPGGDIEIIGRAMTKQERQQRKARLAQASQAAFPFGQNRNYIPVEELVDPKLLDEVFKSEWDADEDWGEEDGEDEV